MTSNSFLAITETLSLRALCTLCLCFVAFVGVSADERAPKLPSHVFAGSFEGVTPGRTSSTELPNLLGAVQQRIDGGKELIFRVASFEEVRCVMKAGTVQQVVVKLRVPSSTAWAKGYLGAEQLKHVDRVDGKLPLRIIPERGIHLVRATATSDDVTEIRVGLPVAADFVARAQDQRKHGFTQTWNDLNVALIMTGEDRIRIELAELAIHLERYARAKDYLDRVAQDHRNPHWKLLFARWVSAIGARKDAVAAIEHIIDDPQTAASVRMAALVERAKVELAGSNGDAEKAAKWLQEATDSAMKTLAQNDQDLPAAKVLFDAHLAMMRAISSGDWSRQHATMERWQANAEQLVPHVMLDGANICAQQDLIATIIASRTQLQEDFHHTPFVRQLEVVTTKLVQKGDSLLAQKARRGAADALTQVAMRQLKDGDHVGATKTFEAALAALTNRSQSDELEAANLRKLVDVLFARGVVDSVGTGDHEAASIWFRRMLSALDDPRVTPYPREATERGDQLVSIGVSFWQIGAKEDAIAVTERGLHYIDSAIAVGWADAADRLVAVENLKAMHQATGNTKAADAYSAQLPGSKK